VKGHRARTGPKSGENGKAATLLWIQWVMCHLGKYSIPGLADFATYVAILFLSTVTVGAYISPNSGIAPKANRS
jgi:hypothetical protein